MASWTWYELVQAKTMVPVFIVHMAQRRNTMIQSWVGMVHSFFSYMLHLSFWWIHPDEDFYNIKLYLYIADKCFIMTMMWGFHYHFEPRSAKIAAFPVVLDISQIVLYQHNYFLKTRFAYFDIFLLVYISLVSFLIIYFLRTPQKMSIGAFIIILCTLGYSMDVNGVMHLSLAPGFWLCYEEIKTRKQQQTKQEEKKFIISTNNKKEHEL